LCYFERRSRVSTYLPKPILGTLIVNNLNKIDKRMYLIVNNFLIKDVQTKNQIVSKCANKNLSIKTNSI